VILVVGELLAPWSGAQAHATAGDIGYQDQSYVGAVNAPTADKPQSKLWYAGGFWWADMFDTTSQSWHIFRLDRTSQTWVDTGVPIDDRPNSSADTLWDGSHLYVASHVVTVSSDTSIKISQPGNPARLYRYSFDSATATWALDAGSPSTINNNSSESMTLDKDSTGRLWVTWTQVGGSATAGYTNAVYVNATTTDDQVWGTPFVLPVNGTNPAPDDISALVSFGGNKVGVLWSNQLDGTVYWAIHVDTNPVGTWRGGSASKGTKIADDHVNLKAIQSDAEGRVYAVVKTSLDSSATATSSSPQINLMVFRPGSNSWSITTFGTLADCHTRPTLMLDDQNSLIHVFATAPTDAGCAYTGMPGTIYEKTASMNNPVFAPGRGTPVIRDAASANMNDATTTKQSVNPSTGLVVLASNQVTKRYWHADVPMTAPVASFTATPVNGTAPLAVHFTDTSTAGPATWSWNFGDGTTATGQNPDHTYNMPGTYPVTLTAANAVGANTSPVQTIVVAPPATGSGSVTAGASTTVISTTAVSSVPIGRPSGLAAGDLMIAQITADNTPAMATVPTGWTAMLPAPLRLSTGAIVYVYYRQVADPAAEPVSWSWSLGSAQKWGAGITTFHGVNSANPFDSDLVSKVDSTYQARSIVLPSVTTSTAGALLVGGIGGDAKNIGATAPSGWVEHWESVGGQDSALGSSPRPAAGATGTVTWTMGGQYAVGGWLRALRPAS